MIRWKWLAAFAAIVIVAAMAAVAQESLDLGAMAAQMRRNQEDIRKYSWQTKMTFFVDGEQQRVDVFTVRYVMGGMVEKMQISSEQAKGQVRGPDGKKLKKKELEAAREFVLEVKGQLDGYLNPLFAEKAVATSKVLKGEDTILLVSRNVMTSGDVVEITLDQSTKKPISATIKTEVEGSPVALDVTFDSIEYGPNYPLKSTTTSQWRGIDLAILTENSNYVYGSR
jgi:hypothetical protein